MNFTKDIPESYLSVVTAKSVLFWLACTFACMTILTHLAQILGITFKIYAYIGLFLMMAMCLLTWIFFQHQRKAISQHDTATSGFLAVLGLTCAFISSFFNTGASRISYDLFYYVANAVYHLQHPDLPMDFAIHFIETGSEPFLAYFGATSLPFEYIQAVIAYFFNTPYLSAFFLFSSALFGFVVPLALFYLICQFGHPKAAAVGAAFTIAVILLLGETPRTPGTWSFPNIYIGKVFFISTGIPLFAAATINFFRTSSRLDWVFMFAVTTALVGTTTSSMALLPALAAILVIAYATVSGDVRIFIKNTLAYASSLSYLILYILTTLMVMNLHASVGANSPVNEGFPVTFWGHAAFFLEKSGPATPLALAGSTLTVILMTSGIVRKFILAWIVATVVLFLNPVVAPFVIKYLTTPNIYWRLFYLYPLPLLLGLTGAKLYELTGRFSRPVRSALISGTVLILVISHFVPFTTSVLYLRTEFGWPRYKMPPTIRQHAEEVIAVAPPGPMLAPLPLGGVITMLSADYPQMRVFNEPERLWFAERGMDSEIDKRICASEFVNGDKPDCLSAFRAMLEDRKLRSVVIARNAALDPQAQDALNDSGFGSSREVDDLLIYWR
ncbi:MAG TPA: DUF6077 domain-containing protein [Nitrosospira sp.]